MAAWALCSRKISGYRAGPKSRADRGGSGRRKFSPEFMTAWIKSCAFIRLRKRAVAEVLDIELGQVQQRVLETAKGQFLSVSRGRERVFLQEAPTRDMAPGI